MDPNAAADKPNIVNQGLKSPVNSPDPLSDLQNVVDAAKKEAAAQTAPLQAPAETPQVQTPQAQFENQFGSGPATPTPAVENPNPAVEAVAPPEQTPADILKKKISADIDAFLAEATKEQVTA